MSESTPVKRLQARLTGKSHVETTTRANRFRRVLSTVAVVIVVMVLLVMLQNLAIRALFPHLTRLVTDFSPAYLSRELRYLARSPERTIFLGDSVLWGYRITPSETAVSLLQSRGLECSNLAFKSGSPANYYALVRLFNRYGVRPSAVVIEINQKVLNAADPAYRTLHPGLEGLATPLLSLQERAQLALVPPTSRASGSIDGWLSSASLLYAMRSDLRETLKGDIDPAPAVTPRSELYEGTYDLSPLTPKNVGVFFLDKTVRLLHSERIPVIAFLTPTNHVLLHEYIDNSEYRANVAFLSSEVTKGGAQLINLDNAFAAKDFLDESHLTVPAQSKLASILRQAIIDIEK